jgi:hypothetical protein
MLMALPIILIMWKKGYFEGILLGQIIFFIATLTYTVQGTYGPQGWVALYYDGFLTTHPEYAIRWVLPTIALGLSGIFNVDHPWITWLIILSATWWLALCLFQQFLHRIGYTRRMSTIGAVLPLLTFSVAFRLFVPPDAFYFLMVIGFLWSIYAWRHLQNPKWLLVIPLIVIAAVGISFPVPPGGGWMTRLSTLPMDVVELLAAGSIYAIFLYITLRYHRDRIPPFVRMASWTIPLYVLVFAIASDWDRWWIMAAPLWVPLVLIGLNIVFNTVVHTKSQNQIESV